MVGDRTTIQVSVELWGWLNGRKRPGESFDDVLRRELPVEAGGASADGGGQSTTEVDGTAEAVAPDLEGGGGQVWYRCGYCGTVFEVSGALVAHVEESHSEAMVHPGMDADHDVIVPDEETGPYHCPDCDLSLDDWETFVTHNEREHGRGDDG